MKIIITRTTGISVMALNPSADADDTIEKWKSSHLGEYVSHREMPDDAIPTDRTFREAWEDSTPELVVDIHMGKARQLHKQRLRDLRAPKLLALDAEYMRADEAGDTVKKGQIAAKKQALRDITVHASIAAASTPDKLKVAAVAVVEAV